MKPDCEACGIVGGSVAELTTPALGTYSACQPCMDVGRRPECHRECGHQGEFTAEGLRWCSTCYDSDRRAKEEEAAVVIAERVRAAEAELDRRIEAAVTRVLAKKSRGRR